MAGGQGGPGGQRGSGRHVHQSPRADRGAPRQQQHAGAGGQGEHVPLLEAVIRKGGGGASAVQIRAVASLQYGGRRLIDALGLLLHPGLGLLQHAGHIGLLQIGLGNQALSPTGGVHRRAADEDNESQQSRGKSSHGASEIM